MANFSELLNKPAEAVEKPKPKPVGTYQAVIQGPAVDKTVKVQGEDRGLLEFKLKMMAAFEGVDADQLAEVGEVSSWPPLTYSIWYDTPEGEFQLRQFLEVTLAIDSSGSKTFGELLAQVPGKQLLATLKHRPFVDKNTGQPEIATDIGSVAKI